VSGINRELQLTIQSAVREAMARRHAYLTVEHLLYALIHDDDGVRILRHCGADLPKLKVALDRFFNESLDKHPADEEGGETSQTLAFHRVMQSALHHAASAEKEEVEAGDLLAAIFQEPDSHAVALLRSQEVSRLDVLHYVSHGISKLPPEGDEEAAGAGVAQEGGAWPKTPIRAAIPCKPSSPISPSARLRALSIR